MQAYLHLDFPKDNFSDDDLEALARAGHEAHFNLRFGDENANSSEPVASMKLSLWDTSHDVSEL